MIKAKDIIKERIKQNSDKLIKLKKETLKLCAEHKEIQNKYEESVLKYNLKLKNVKWYWLFNITIKNEVLRRLKLLKSDAYWKYRELESNYLNILDCENNIVKLEKELKLI